MLTSKKEVKKEIASIIPRIGTNFTTNQIKQELHTNKVALSNQRLQKYIKATGQVDFDKTNKVWNIRQTKTTPDFIVNGKTKAFPQKEKKWRIRPLL